MLDALELLMDQHEEVEGLIERVEDADDSGTKAELFRELADKLAAHSTIEEKIFYPAMMADKTRELLVESTEEHLSIKRLLADMMTLDVADEHFDAKLSVLKKQIRHHAHDEEEGHLFPIVRKLCSRDELAAIGNELLALFEKLITREPRRNVPSETSHAAPLPA